MTLSLRQLADFNRDVLVRKALDGELATEDVWTVTKGAGKYLRAVATGNVRSERDSITCAGRCLVCPELTWEATKLPDVMVAFCGAAGKNREKEESRPTCGCNVVVLVNGVVYAGGKPRAKSDSCQQRKWDDV